MLYIYINNRCKIVIVLLIQAIMVKLKLTLQNLGPTAIKQSAELNYSAKRVNMWKIVKLLYTVEFVRNQGKVNSLLNLMSIALPEAIICWM
jgi:hypothetical protein